MVCGSRPAKKNKNLENIPVSNVLYGFLSFCWVFLIIFFTPAISFHPNEAQHYDIVKLYIYLLIHISHQH